MNLIIEAGIKSSYSLIITKPTVISVAFEKAQNITIKGDERVEETAVEIPENTSWEVIKSYVVEKLQLKNEWQGGDYGVYEWKLNDENGAAIDDSDSLTAGTTVYVVTNYTKFKTEPVGGDIVLAGYTGEKPRGHIILPSGITKIGEGAFNGCSDLAGRLVIPSGVREIGYNSFKGCSGLNSLAIPDGVTKIEVAAFSGCQQLKDGLRLPSTLTVIGGFAFYECKNLTGELELPVNLISLGQKAFSGCSGFSSVKIRSDKITNIDTLAFGATKAGITFIVRTSDVRAKLITSSNDPSFGSKITVDSSI